jgi:hypothetical protein
VLFSPFFLKKSGGSAFGLETSQHHNPDQTRLLGPYASGAGPQMRV